MCKTSHPQGTQWYSTKLEPAWDVKSLESHCCLITLAMKSFFKWWMSWTSCSTKTQRSEDKVSVCSRNNWTWRSSRGNIINWKCRNEFGQEPGFLSRNLALTRTVWILLLKRQGTSDLLLLLLKWVNPMQSHKRRITWKSSCSNSITFLLLWLRLRRPIKSNWNKLSRKSGK